MSVADSPVQIIEEPNGFKIVLDKTPIGRASALVSRLGPDEVEVRFSLGGILNATRRASPQELSQWIEECISTLQQIKMKLSHAS